MNKHEREPARQREIIPSRKLRGTVAETLAATGKNFVSEPVKLLSLGYEGIRGDFHAGLTRRSGSREPWYEHGTEMRNERQISIVSREEMAQIADDMGIIRLNAGWIGANLVLEGIPDLTFLPPRSLLFFENGVTLRIDGHNGPCRTAGGEIARALGARAIDRAAGEDGRSGGPLDWTRTDVARRFVPAAHMKRGLVAWVEREGEIRPGESVTVRVWEQWIY